MGSQRAFYDYLGPAIRHRAYLGNLPRVVGYRPRMNEPACHNAIT